MTLINLVRLAVTVKELVKTTKFIKDGINAKSQEHGDSQTVHKKTEYGRDAKKETEYNNKKKGRH